MILAVILEWQGFHNTFQTSFKYHSFPPTLRKSCINDAVAYEVSLAKINNMAKVEINFSSLGIRKNTGNSASMLQIAI
jgi:hypothetical protein